MRHQDASIDAPAYIEVRPPDALAAYVEACWFYHASFTAPRPDILIPEGIIDLVFNFGDPYYREPANSLPGEGKWISGDVVVGQRTRLFRVEWPRDTRLFAIRLKAETAYLFFKLSMQQLTDRTEPLKDMGFLELSRAVHEFPYEDRTSIVNHCFDFLASRTSGFEKPDARLSAVIQTIKKQKGNLDVQGICHELGCNRRTIERLFAQKVGTSPKFFARAIRLHYFLVQQRERREDNLAHAATDAQYYDQSHLIRDFKEFTGESPARFFNAPPDIYEPLLVSLLGRREQGRE